jgi:hypothetical protein
MKNVQVFQELSIEGRNNVIVGTSCWEGLDDLSELVGSLVDEQTEIRHLREGK